MKRIRRFLKRIIKYILDVDRNDERYHPPPTYIGATIIDPEKVSIGERVSFGGQVRIFNTAPVRIGNDCMIAFGTQILTATHNHANHPMWKHRIDRPVEIGNHVWIGTNAIILPGVKIGDYAVIGAGAVVSAHVPERAVVVGNPARIVEIRPEIAYDVSALYPGEPVELDFFPEEKVTKRK